MGKMQLPDIPTVEQMINAKSPDIGTLNPIRVGTNPATPGQYTSVAIGEYATVEGYDSIAIGKSSIGVCGGIAIGSWTRTGTNSIAIGSGANAESATNAVAVGIGVAVASNGVGIGLYAGTDRKSVV